MPQVYFAFRNCSASPFLIPSNLLPPPFWAQALPWGGKEGIPHTWGWPPLLDLAPPCTHSFTSSGLDRDLPHQFRCLWVAYQGCQWVYLATTGYFIYPMLRLTESSSSDGIRTLVPPPSLQTEKGMGASVGQSWAGWAWSVLVLEGGLGSLSLLTSSHPIGKSLLIK